MAEVLVTLGIIGVVAAMTMPAVIANYQKQETVNKLKKTYSVLNQAVKQAEVIEGETGNWDFSLSPTEFYLKYFKPYLVVTQEYINQPLAVHIDYTCLKGNTGTECNGYSGHQDTTKPKAMLSDGSFFTLQGVSNNSKSIIINLNGYKKPNKWGKDVFAFSIMSGKGIVPYGLYSGVVNEDGEAIGSFGNIIDREIIINSDNARACNKDKDGVWCAALIMLDGWEIKKDYPW